MHHALLSLMLMTGVCGDAPQSEPMTAPQAVVSKCELPSVLADLFVMRNTATEISADVDRLPANCQAK